MFLPSRAKSECSLDKARHCFGLKTAPLDLRDATGHRESLCKKGYGFILAKGLFRLNGIQVTSRRKRGIRVKN
eukprot:1161320-Pelagomonas_calceolata.AAC.3